MNSKKLVGGLVLVMTSAAAAIAAAPTHPAVHHPTAVHRPAAVKTALVKPTSYKPAVAPPSSAGLPKPAEMIGGLPWYHVTDGFALAKKLNKPVLVDVYTDWCGWCKVMDRQTFPDKAVKDVLSSKFVLVKANAEDNADGQQLAQKFEVNGFPTTLLFDTSGKVAGFNGFKEPKEFLALLDQFFNLKQPIAGKKDTVSVHESAPAGTTVSMPVGATVTMPTENSAVIPEATQEAQPTQQTNPPAP